MSDKKSPARQILENPETHGDLSTKEAREVCGYGTNLDARRLYQELAERQLLRRTSKRHGAQRFTRGRYFGQ